MSFNHQMNNFGKREIYDATIKRPFKMIISGPSNVGKSRFTFNLLKHRDKLIGENAFVSIYYFYGKQNTGISDLKAWSVEENINLHLIEGLETFDVDDLIDTNGGHVLIIFDDLMEQVMQPEFTNLFTMHSHHSNLSIVLIVQDFFFNAGGGKSSSARVIITRNTNYFVLFNSPLDNETPLLIGKKVMPGASKTFMSIFKHACKNFRYLLIDGSIITDNSIRFRTNLFDKIQNVYILD